MARLLKLTRLLRANRVISKWSARVSLSSSAKEGIFYVFLVLFTLHWLACAWSALAQFQGSLRTPELMEAVANQMETDATCGGCTPEDSASAFPPTACLDECLTDCEVAVLAGLWGEKIDYVRNSEHWICRAAGLGGTLSSKSRDSTGGIFEIWVFAMLVALAQLCGGAVVIAPQNTSEYVPCLTQCNAAIQCTLHSAHQLSPAPTVRTGTYSSSWLCSRARSSGRSCKE